MLLEHLQCLEVLTKVTSCSETPPNETHESTAKNMALKYLQRMYFQTFESLEVLTKVTNR
jgi:hypothetical protein